jgi:hypothetical protein
MKPYNNMNMKKLTMMLTVLVASLAMQAQDKVLKKYTKMGDVNTVFVSKSMLSEIPLEKLDVPGLAEVFDQLESMTMLISRGDKAGKEMGTKLPRQLMAAGFEQVMETERNGWHIRVLQSKEDSSRVVMVLYDKPHATVVSMKGNFSAGLPVFDAKEE